MKAIRTVIALICALAASALACAEEKPPLQQPQLRIEAKMHTSLISRLDVSADGLLMATASEDKSVRLWSLPSGELQRVFRVPIGPGNQGKVYAVALSPDGKLLAAGGWDAYWSDQDRPTEMFVYLFDTTTGALVKRLGPIPNVVLDLAFSPDGERLAAGAGRGGLWVWSRPFTGEAIVDRDYGQAVYGVAFDRSGSGRLATTSYDGMIRLYDGDTSAPVTKAKASRGKRPLGIDFSPDGKTLAVGYSDTRAVDLIAVPALERRGAADTKFASASLSRVAWAASSDALYAGGAHSEKTGENAIIRFPKGGKGKPEAIGGPDNSIQDLMGIEEGVAFASADPAFGLYGADTPVLFRGPVGADMRGKFGKNFAMARDASAVWFGLKTGSKDAWRFDVTKLSFAATATKPAGDIVANTDRLPIRNWQDSHAPTLGPDIIHLLTNETSRSLAIAPDRQSLILGTEWSVYRFDAAGKLLWRVPSEGVTWGVNLSDDGSIVVAALGDGTIRWYRASDGAPLLNLYVHVASKRWIAWTPSGYYAASPGGEDLIGWHVNGKSWDAPVDFFPAALFREKFYRPDIVQLVLKEIDEARAVAKANEAADRSEEEAALPPVVEIIADPRGVEAEKPELALAYRLRSPSGKPVTRLELRVDGQLTQTRGMEVVDESLELGRELTMTVPLPSRDATISLIAFIGDQASEPASLAVKWKGGAKRAAKPKLHALLIGVSGYDEPKLKLNYAAKDAADVEAAFMRQKGKFFSNVETVLLTDHKASENKIEIELSKLRDKVGPDDYVIVFMAGHGVTDAQGGFHFLPADASLAPNELAATSLNGLIIRDNLRTMKGKVLLFMDACNAGNGIESDKSLADMTGFANEFAQSNGVVMYASSTGRQFSYENSQWQNGAFTDALISVFDDPRAYGNDGLLSISELDEELTSRVEALTGGLQTPVMTKSAAIPRFFVAALN